MAQACLQAFPLPMCTCYYYCTHLVLLPSPTISFSWVPAYTHTYYLLHTYTLCTYHYLLVLDATYIGTLPLFSTTTPLCLLLPAYYLLPACLLPLLPTKHLFSAFSLSTYAGLDSSGLGLAFVADDVNTCGCW